MTYLLNNKWEGRPQELIKLYCPLFGRNANQSCQKYSNPPAIGIIVEGRTKVRWIVNSHCDGEGRAH
jgi:hypothetical protein